MFILFLSSLFSWATQPFSPVSAVTLLHGSHSLVFAGFACIKHGPLAAVTVDPFVFIAVDLQNSHRVLDCLYHVEYSGSLGESC